MDSSLKDENFVKMSLLLKNCKTEHGLDVNSLYGNLDTKPETDYLCKRIYRAGAKNIALFLLYLGRLFTIILDPKGNRVSERTFYFDGFRYPDLVNYLSQQKVTQE